MVVQRLNNDEIKARVISRDRLKKQRDEVMAGLDLSAIEGGNITAVVGLMGKLDDIKTMFDMTRAIEELSDELTREQVLRLVENG